MCRCLCVSKHRAWKFFGSIHLGFETGSLTLVLDKPSALESMRPLNTDRVAVRFEARPIDHKARAMNHSVTSKAVCVSLYSLKGWGRGNGEVMHL